MLRYGVISEVDYKSGRARVNLDDLGIVTDWLTLPKNINENRFFDINTQVAVLIHENGEDGEILHTVPSDEKLPPSWADENTEGYQFQDGTVIHYSKSTKKMTIVAGSSGFSELVVPGDLNVDGDITVSGDVKATGDVLAGTVSLKNHIHIATPALTAGSTPVTGTVTIAKP